MKIFKILFKVIIIVILFVFIINLVLKNISYSFYKGERKMDNLKVLPKKVDYGNGLTGYGYNMDKKSKSVILCFGGSFYIAYNTVGSFASFYDVPFLAVDYYGTQDSQGKMNLKGMQASAEALYDWVKEKYPGCRIIIIGHSYGCGMAAYLASVRVCDGLYLAAGYRDLSDLYNRIVPVFWGPLKLLISDNIKVYEYAEKTDCPVTVIGSDADGTLSGNLQRKLARYYRQVELHIFSDIEHEDYLTDERVVELIRNSLE
ncbi:MAG: alpha/beta hydrolase [Erysipelotrichaceae bacterium]